MRKEYDKEQEIVKSVNVDECNKRLLEVEEAKKKLEILEPKVQTLTLRLEPLNKFVWGTIIIILTEFMSALAFFVFGR